jgi:hypothetical protein
MWSGARTGLLMGLCALQLFGAHRAEAASPAAAVQPDGAGALRGRVAERLDSAGYTYLLLSTSAGKVWCAVPASPAKVGDEVTVDTQTRMANFESRTLKRTFDAVYFGTVRTQGAAAPAQAPASVPAPTHARAPVAASAGEVQGTVKELLEAPGYTYLRLDTASGEQWAAVPTTKAKVGDRIHLGGVTVMQGFESKTLKRRFDRILFATVIQSPGEKPGAKPAGAR